jgi:hypothetical protein
MDPKVMLDQHNPRFLCPTPEEKSVVLVEKVDLRKAEKLLRAAATVPKSPSITFSIG